jgi:hypothetical protein
MRRALDALTNYKTANPSSLAALAWGVAGLAPWLGPDEAARREAASGRQALPP